VSFTVRRTRKYNAYTSNEKSIKFLPPQYQPYLQKCKASLNPKSEQRNNYTGSAENYRSNSREFIAEYISMIAKANKNYVTFSSSSDFYHCADVLTVRSQGSSVTSVAG
jgi:hypothetical protein